MPDASAEQDDTLRGMTAGELAATFAQKKSDFERMHEKSGMLRAIEALSRAVGDIKDAGHDVALTLYGNASEESFGIFSRGGGLTVPASGVLRIGDSHRLIAIATKAGGRAALQIGMSEFDIRHNGAEGTMKEGDITPVVRADIYDLKANPAALKDLQAEILRSLARDQVVAEHDAAAAFEKTPSQFGKKFLKPPQK